MVEKEEMISLIICVSLWIEYWGFFYKDNVCFFNLFNFFFGREIVIVIELIMYFKNMIFCEGIRIDFFLLIMNFKDFRIWIIIVFFWEESLWEELIMVILLR